MKYWSENLTKNAVNMKCSKNNVLKIEGGKVKR